MPTETPCKLWTFKSGRLRWTPFLYRFNVRAFSVPWTSGEHWWTPREPCWNAHLLSVNAGSPAHGRPVHAPLLRSDVIQRLLYGVRLLCGDRALALLLLLLLSIPLAHARVSLALNRPLMA
jgi:hypothetical protein